MASKKNNLDKIKDITEQLSKEEVNAVIALPSKLIQFVGNVSPRSATQKTVFLAQLIYWSDKGGREDGFFYKKRETWTKETGLSEGQLSAYTDEFRRLGFLDTKVKKANGIPTVHYKVLMTPLLNAYRQYLENGNLEKSEKESRNYEDSITENTTKNSHTLKKSIFKDGEGSGSERKEVLFEVIAFSANINPLDNKTKFDLVPQCRLPLNFIPSWQKQFDATQHFPQKSPSYVTEKFIAFYQNKDTAMTLYDWNLKWWDWMVTEKPHFKDLDALEKEHLQIYNQIRTKVLILFECVESKVIHQDRFVHVFSFGGFSEATVDLMLRELVEDGHLACVEGYYYETDMYQESDEWKQEVDRELAALIS